jgi:hypothetical protein
MAKAINPPWLMWGSTALVRISGDVVGGTLQAVRTPQLAAIDFKRPESWKFMLAVQALAVNGPALAGVTFSVFFNLRIGLGRAAVNLTLDQNQAFASFQTGVVPGGNYTTQVQQLALLWTPQQTAIGLPTPQQAQWTDTFPAETIQCDAIAGFDNARAGTTVDLNITAMFAPVSHIRADWYGKGALGGAER